MIKGNYILTRASKYSDFSLHIGVKKLGYYDTNQAAQCRTHKGVMYIYTKTRGKGELKYRPLRLPYKPHIFCQLKTRSQNSKNVLNKRI